MMASGINPSVSDAMLLLTAAAASAKSPEPYGGRMYAGNYPVQAYHLLPAVRRAGSGVVPLAPTLKAEFRNDGEVQIPSPRRRPRQHPA